MDYTLSASDRSLHTSIDPLMVPYTGIRNPVLTGLNPAPDEVSNRCGELFTPEVQADYLGCVMRDQTPYPPSPQRDLVMPNIITGGEVEFEPMPYHRVLTPIPVITPHVVASPIVYPVSDQLPSPVNVAPSDLWNLIKDNPGPVYDSNIDGSRSVLTRTDGPEVATITGGVGTMHDFLTGTAPEAAGPAAPVEQPKSSWLPLLMIAIAVFK